MKLGIDEVMIALTSCVDFWAFLLFLDSYAADTSHLSCLAFNISPAAHARAAFSSFSITRRHGNQHASCHALISSHIISSIYARAGGAIQ